MNETLKLLANNQLFTTIGGIMIVLLSGITAFLANRNIACYNDGVRPLIGQKKLGSLKYRALAGMSLAMSIGYVVGFIPFSITQNILVVHTVLLGSEMIGLLFQKDEDIDGKFKFSIFNLKNMKYSIMSTATAMIYGGAIFWGLNALGDVIDKITYPGFGFNLGMIVDGAFPFIFAMFPVIALIIQSGWKKGSISAVVSILTYILIARFGWTDAKLYPMAMTLLVGTIILFGFAILDHYQMKKQSSDSEKTSKSQIKDTFKLLVNNAEEIKKNKWWFVLSGAITSMAVASFGVAPLVSLALQTTSIKEGDVVSALIADTTWVIGFLPLVVLTALLTGVYSPVGLTAVFVWGDLAKIIGASIVQSTNNETFYLFGVLLAGVIGGLSMFIEVYLLKSLAKLLLRIPGIQKVSDSMRQGIAQTINYAFLMGGIIAAFLMGQSVAGLLPQSMAGLAFWLPSLGAGLVILIVLLNSLTKKLKISEIAVGPLGALSVGVLFNIIYFVSLI